jgi:hypothetical protein
MEAAIEKLASTGTDFCIPDSISECQVLVRQAQKSIRQLEKHSLALRQHNLEQQALACMQQVDKVNSKRIRILIKAERTKQLYRKLRKIRNVAKQGITKLDVPSDSSMFDYKECKEWITITLSQEIEDKLRQRNQAHFGQAFGTFPTVPPSFEWVDWSVSTHVADLLIEGSFPSDDLTDIQQLLLDHMQARTALDSIYPEVTPSEYLHRIKLWPKKTTTSPSGLHLGHSKVLLAPHDKPADSPESIAIEDNRHKLITWQIRLINLALRNKYSFKRWQTIVNVMILKEPNIHKIHRPCVIHLYKHDYNLLLGLKWRALITHCQVLWNKTRLLMLLPMVMQRLSTLQTDTKGVQVSMQANRTINTIDRQITDLQVT